jgi:hypothetical protein
MNGTHFQSRYFLRHEQLRSSQISASLGLKNKCRNQGLKILKYPLLICAYNEWLLGFLSVINFVLPTNFPISYKMKLLLQLCICLFSKNNNRVYCVYCSVFKY